MTAHFLLRQYLCVQGCILFQVVELGWISLLWQSLSEMDMVFMGEFNLEGIQKKYDSSCVDTEVKCFARYNLRCLYYPLSTV